VVTVTPAAAASLVVTAPGLVGTGKPFDVNVKALDAYGNTATGYTGIIHFTTTDGAATPPAGYTFTGADAGTRTFSATLVTLGTRTITATDTVFTATSGLITVALTVPVPTFTRIDPVTGPTTGNTVVTITGTGFTGASTVTFGGTASGPFTINSDTQITTTTPAHAAGVVNVVVTTGGGTATGAGAYTYVMPVPPTTAPTFRNPGDTSDSGDNGPASSTTTMPTGTQQASGTVPVNVGGKTSISGIVVTGTGNSGIIVTATEASGPGQDIPLPPGIVYQYLDITPARYGTITGAEISFVVPQFWLDEHHLTPQDIVMYHNVGTSWQVLPTRLVKSANGQLWFTATSPGLSRFAITGQAGSVSSVQVTTASPGGNTFGSMAGTSDSPVTVKPVISHGPVVAQTMAAPALPDTGFPVMPVALIAVCGIGLIGGSLLVRRWWIRRQNPALFREYD
jgi:PGF-pre-PGF domain-containing protein